MSTLDAIQEKRALRRALEAEALEVQLAVDYEAIDALEETHGSSNIAVRLVDYVPELPAAVVVRTPTGVELKRYRDRLREANPDAVKAAEEVGQACRVYPAADVFAALLAKRPALLVQMGTAAIKLASARAEDEGKDSLKF
jgi:hypothetical protein